MHAASAGPLYAVIPTFVLVGPLAHTGVAVPGAAGGTGPYLAALGRAVERRQHRQRSVDRPWLVARPCGRPVVGHGTGAVGAVAVVSLLGAIVSSLRARQRAGAAPGAASSAPPREAVILAVAAAAFVLLATVAGPRAAPEVVWIFEATERGLVLGSPRVAGDHVYVAAAHSTIEGPFGAVYCLDPRPANQSGRSAAAAG